MKSRTATALVGFLLSVAASVLLWWQYDTFLLFLFVPFVPFLFRRRTDAPPVKTCSTCGFRTREPTYAHCPRDGTRLEGASDLGDRATDGSPSRESP